MATAVVRMFTYVSPTLTSSATLSPRTSLRRGDPKQDAMPIPGLPALATAVSATQSPTELPIASTVSPRMAVGVTGEECTHQHVYKYMEFKNECL